MKLRIAVATAVLCSLVIAPAQTRKPAAAPAPAVPAPQKNDEEYGKLIKQYLQDPRITTELVDHLPASDTVPTPLKFFGRIPGTPGELTYAKDIYRYYEALAKASPRAKFWTMSPIQIHEPLKTVGDHPELSQRELGNIVGSTRESVNKCMREWQRSETIRIEDNSIRHNIGQSHRSDSRWQERGRAYLQTHRVGRVLECPRKARIQ
jgi:hypothetical protein